MAKIWLWENQNRPTAPKIIRQKYKKKPRKWRLQQGSTLCLSDGSQHVLCESCSSPDHPSPPRAHLAESGPFHTLGHPYSAVSHEWSNSESYVPRAVAWWESRLGNLSKQCLQTSFCQYPSLFLVNFQRLIPFNTAALPLRPLAGNITWPLRAWRLHFGLLSLLPTTRVRRR